MNINQNNALSDQNDDLKNNSINNADASDDGIGENSEQTPLAQAVAENDPGKSLQGSEGGNGWKNNKPGATNEEKNEKLIPVPPENENESAGK